LLLEVEKEEGATLTEGKDDSLSKNSQLLTQIAKARGECGGDNRLDDFSDLSSGFDNMLVDQVGKRRFLAAEELKQRLVLCLASKTGGELGETDILIGLRMRHYDLELLLSCSEFFDRDRDEEGGGTSSRKTHNSSLTSTRLDVLGESSSNYMLRNLIIEERYSGFWFAYLLSQTVESLLDETDSFCCHVAASGFGSETGLEISHNDRDKAILLDAFGGRSVSSEGAEAVNEGLSIFPPLLVHLLELIGFGVCSRRDV